MSLKIVRVHAQASNKQSNLVQAFQYKTRKVASIPRKKAFYLDCVLIRTETGRPVNVGDIMPAKPVTHDILLPQYHHLDTMQDPLHIYGRAVPQALSIKALMTIT